MKRFLSLLLAVALISGMLAGCGTKEVKSKGVAQSLGQNAVEGFRDNIKAENSGHVQENESELIEIPADYDPNTYWKENPEKLWYDGKFVIKANEEYEGIETAIRIEMDGDDYLMFRIAIGDMEFNIFSEGADSYMMTSEGNYHFTSDSDTNDVASSFMNVDIFQQMVDAMVYVETIDNEDVYACVVRDEYDIATKYDVYVSFEVGGITKIVDDSETLYVSKLDKHSYSAAECADFEELSDDIDAASVLFGNIMSMMLQDEDYTYDNSIGSDADNTAETFGAQ